MTRGGRNHTSVQNSDLHLKLQTQLRTVIFADAHVEAQHEGPSDPNSTATGGAFFSQGSISLTRSHLTAPWTWFLSSGSQEAVDQSILMQRRDAVDTLQTNDPTKVRGTGAIDGGGFFADGNLILGGIAGCSRSCWTSLGSWGSGIWWST